MSGWVKAGLQWGRTFSSAESGCGRLVCDLESLRFNGAALFQVRKVGSQKRQISADDSFNGAALFQVRKVGQRGQLTRAEIGFNGAALFQVRKVALNANETMLPAKLQWGRTFSSAESRLHHWNYPRRLVASMGPHFFKCGKEAKEWMLESIKQMASMGPHFFKCGKSKPKASGPRRVRRFNGAALFQVRKVDLLIAQLGDNEKLQWGRTFSSAESPHGILARLQPSKLQWGRTFSSAERSSCRKENVRDCGASMGPHFFKCGKPVRTG